MQGTWNGAKVAIKVTSTDGLQTPSGSGGAPRTEDSDLCGAACNHPCVVDTYRVWTQPAPVMGSSTGAGTNSAAGSSESAPCGVPAGIQASSSGAPQWPARRAAATRIGPVPSRVGILCQILRHPCSNSRHTTALLTNILSAHHSVSPLSCSRPNAAGSEQVDSTVAVQQFLLMEFCDLGTLHDAVQTKKFYSDPARQEGLLLTTVLRCLADIADAMQHLHEQARRSSQSPSFQSPGHALCLEPLAPSTHPARPGAARLKERCCRRNVLASLGVYLCPRMLSSR